MNSSSVCVSPSPSSSQMANGSPKPPSVSAQIRIRDQNLLYRPKQYSSFSTSAFGSNASKVTSILMRKVSKPSRSHGKVTSQGVNPIGIYGGMIGEVVGNLGNERSKSKPVERRVVVTVPMPAGFRSGSIHRIQRPNSSGKNPDCKLNKTPPLSSPTNGGMRSLAVELKENVSRFPTPELPKIKVEVTKLQDTEKRSTPSRDQNVSSSGMDELKPSVIKQIVVMRKKRNSQCVSRQQIFSRNEEKNPFMSVHNEEGCSPTKQPKLRRCSVVIEKLKESVLVDTKPKSQFVAPPSSPAAPPAFDQEYDERVLCSPASTVSVDDECGVSSTIRGPDMRSWVTVKKRRLVNSFADLDENEAKSEEVVPDACEVDDATLQKENKSTRKHLSNGSDLHYKFSQELTTLNGRPRRVNPNRFVKVNPVSESRVKDIESEDEDLRQAIQESKRLADKMKRLDTEAAKLPTPPSGVPLTESMLDIVKARFELPKNTKVVSKFRLTIKQNHLALFNEREWLEDPVIDFYLEMIKDRNDRMRSMGLDYPKIYVFHGYFFKLCSKNEFDAVKEFTNDNIFDYDLAFFPILIKDHWRIIVADFNEKTLYCYDSLYRVNDPHLRTISKYLEQEYKLKVQKRPRSSITKFDPDIPDNSATMSPESEADDPVETISEVISSSSAPESRVEEATVEPLQTSSSVPTVPSWETYFEGWTVDTLDPIATPLPQQNNGHDCGIFLCQYAEALARRAKPPFDFSQVNMLYFRYLMAYETIQGNLVDRGHPVTSSDSPST